MEPIAPLPRHYSVRAKSRGFLSAEAFEIQLPRPAGFIFQPGQRIALTLDGVTREYSIASAPAEGGLTLCIRLVANGELSPVLARMDLKRSLAMEGPLGHFLFQPSDYPAVFIAGGTGVAPFRAMVAHGMDQATLLQGARNLREAYYHGWFSRRLDRHILCLSQDSSQQGRQVGIQSGRVTDFLIHQLPTAPYDFYVCGGPQLVRDAMAVIDGYFPQSRVRTELFN